MQCFRALDLAEASSQFGLDGVVMFMHSNIPEWDCEAVPPVPLRERQRFPILMVEEGSVDLDAYTGSPEWKAAGGRPWYLLEVSLWGIVRGVCDAVG